MIHRPYKLYIVFGRRTYFDGTIMVYLDSGIWHPEKYTHLIV